MKHSLVVQWLAEGSEVVALPTARGARNAFLLNRGVVTALLKLSEADYSELVGSGRTFTYDRKGGLDDAESSAPPATRIADEGRTSRAGVRTAQVGHKRASYSDGGRGPDTAIGDPRAADASVSGSLDCD